MTKKLVLLIVLALSTTFAERILLGDDMSAIPGNWQLGGTAGQYWTQKTNRWYSHSASVKCTPTDQYANNVDVTMTAAVDVSAYSMGIATFWIWQNTELGYDYVSFDYSTDSTNWTSLWSRSGSYAAWAQITVTGIPSNAQYVRFRFYTNNTFVSEGVYIDDVIIYGVTTTETTIFADSMNTFPTGWTLWGNYNWKKDTTRFSSDSASAKCCSTANYFNNQNNGIDRTFSLTGYYQGKISYNLYHATEAGHDYVFVQYRIGTTWYTLYTGTGFSDWTHYVYYLPNTANAIRFYFQSDAATTAEGLYVDDVVLEGITVPTVDMMTTTLLSPPAQVDTGTIVPVGATITNNGIIGAGVPIYYRIGTAYNAFSWIDSLAPGASVTESFPSWTALARGSYALACTTAFFFDGTPANNKKTGTCVVRVHDLRTTAVSAPGMFVDSGTVIAPKARVKNTGSDQVTTATVLMTIGTDYSDIQAVSNVAPGDSRILTFANWSALVNGVYTLSCSTRLTDDMNLPNDKVTFPVTVAYVDVAPTLIIAPPDSVDSGFAMVPACSVKSFSSIPVSYRVRMKIGAVVNDTTRVDAQAPGSTVYVTFKPYSAWRRGTPYPVTCTTELTGDVVPTNNRLTSTTYPRVHDVGVATLVAPTGTLDSGITYTPACTVYNYGTAIENYQVRMKVGAYYNEVVPVTGHAPDTKLYLTFPSSLNWPRGAATATCTTELAGDARTVNDKKTAAITARVQDVAVQRILIPIGVADSGAIVTPACTLRNFSSIAQTYTARMKIGNFYNKTAAVSGQAAGALTRVVFPNCTLLTRGMAQVVCTTELAADINPANDKLQDSVLIRVMDVGITAWLAPIDTVDSGFTAKPSVTIRNNGSRYVDSVNVVFTITDGYTNTVKDTALQPGDERTIDFAYWTPTKKGMWIAKCTTKLVGDQVGANNKIIDTVYVATFDVGVQALLAPMGTLDSGATITPACSVANYGTAGATYNVRMKIGSFYNEVVPVVNQLGNTRAYITFPSQTGLPRGTHTVTCTTEFARDWKPTNDKRSASITVQVPDVGCVKINVPKDTVDSGQVIVPSCSLYNYGSSTVNYAVRLRIGTTYSNAATIYTHAPGTYRLATFPAWTANALGVFEVRCSTELSNDCNRANDKFTDTVIVRQRPVGIAEPDANPVVPKVFALDANRPNPFAAQTEISYALPRACHVRLQIYDPGGRLVQTLVNGEQNPGFYSVRTAPYSLPRGVYFCRFRAADFTAVRKMTSIVQ